MFEIQSVKEMKCTMSENLVLLQDWKKNTTEILSNYHNLLLSLIYREEEWERREGETLEWKPSSCRKPQTQHIEQLLDDIRDILSQEGVVDSWKIEETVKIINEFSQHNN